RVSVSSTGAQGLNGDAKYASISASGRYVSFVSRANNIAGTGESATPHIYLHDNLTGQTKRIDLNPVTGDSARAGTVLGQQFTSISADGSTVAFSSFADNLLPGYVYNTYAQSFVHDERVLSAVVQVNVAPNTLRVTAFTPTSRGFSMQFSAAI